MSRVVQVLRVSRTQLRRPLENRRGLWRLRAAAPCIRVTARSRRPGALRAGTLRDKAKTHRCMSSPRSHRCGPASAYSDRGIFPTDVGSANSHHGADADLNSEIRMRKCSVPGGLPTLAWAVPGQSLVVRHILRGAGIPCRRLHNGDTVVCREVTEGGLLLDLEGVSVRIPNDCARYILVEVIAPKPPPEEAGPDADTGAARKREKQGVSTKGENDGWQAAGSVSHRSRRGANQ
jgi:hypothetical protein